ncbi:P-loop ATPase, Sll1717 family [Pseudomonas gingeri]|uniref:P-loop ATPase, Sll1717 family n=1 Tax=Pseudomonas gingeri TaxID=117681 RepID=UPI0015A28BE4|nr:hypothetical protein [Pseudomonas gingeri]NWE29583.1 hypothetical protein [Pseudomonas gingeri]NWE98224.1 hypothetical protein [Pseudomonas gingeri]
MDNLDHLDRFFFGGEAEAESEIRNDIFVEPEAIDELLSFRSSRYKVLSAPKGVGKTILLSVLHESILEHDQISLLLTPRDMDCKDIFDKDTLADRISCAYRQLLTSAGAHIGSLISDVGVSDAVVNLQGLSLDQGLTRPDIISRASRFLAAIAPKGKDIAEAAREIQKLNKAVAVLKKDVRSVLEKNKNKLWLLIDDIDFAAVDKDGRYDYSACWAIISAAMDLANDFDQVRCLISVRSDVWHVMTKVKRLGAERLDKFKKPVGLSFTEDGLRKMFLRRLELASNAAGASATELELFFVKPWLVLPGMQEGRRSWDQWISKSSRDKPRDMVQLVQALIEEARKKRSSKIGDDHAHSVVLEFSRERVENISTEYQQICPQINTVIKSVCTRTIFSFEQIIELLKQAPSARAVEVDGVRLKPGDRSSALRLLAVLHMANFLNPRVQKGERYEHLLFSDSPGLINDDNWNEMQSYQWEIHPAFHSYVNQQKNRNILK